MTFVSTGIYHGKEIWQARKGYYDPDDKKEYKGFKAVVHSFWDNFKGDVHSVTKESTKLIVQDVVYPVVEEVALPIGTILIAGLGLYYVAKNI